LVNLSVTSSNIAGSGQAGLQDGPFDKASFDHPQGMALVGNQLYVADTENHLLRSVDLTSKTVHTFAGTGKPKTKPAAQVANV